MPTKIRAFIAVEIDYKIKQKISELASVFKKSGTDAKWADENQMHLTLKFLGNINKDNLEEISGAISSISNDFKSFVVSFSKIGTFPDTNHPRVIWLGIDKGAEDLKTLNYKVESALEKLGFAKEARKFEPHLTLARIRSPRNISNLIKLIGETTCDIKDEARINKITLFQSSLNSKGAVYSVLLEKFLQNINGTKD